MDINNMLIVSTKRKQLKINKYNYRRYSNINIPSQVIKLKIFICYSDFIFSIRNHNHKGKATS